MDGKTLELEKDFEVSPYFWNVKDRLDYYQAKSPITKQALLAKNFVKCSRYLGLLADTMKKKQDGENSEGEGMKKRRVIKVPFYFKYKGDAHNELMRYKRYVDSALQRSTEKRPLKFELSKPRAFRLFRSPCHYCGLDPKITGKLNGIDRVDSKKSYVEGNVVPCCGECNTLKGVLSYNTFLHSIQRIHSFQTKERKLINGQIFFHFEPEILSMEQEEEELENYHRILNRLQSQPRQNKTTLRNSFSTPTTISTPKQNKKRKEVTPIISKRGQDREREKEEEETKRKMAKIQESVTFIDLTQEIPPPQPQPRLQPFQIPQQQEGNGEIGIIEDKEECDFWWSISV